VFQPERGRENPVIARAIDLYHQSGIAVVFHADTVEVRFASNNKRFYPTWSQFLDDAAAIFGDRLPGGTGAGINLDTDMPGTEKPSEKSAASAPGGVPQSVRAEREAIAATKLKAAEEAVAAAEAAEVTELPPSDDEQIKALKREIRLLKRAIKVVGTQREEWEREAVNAREALESARDDMRSMAQNKSTANGADRYRQLRQVVVRRLHPDVPGTPDEKRVREQLFKQIWKEVEHLDRQ